MADQELEVIITSSGGLNQDSSPLSIEPGEGNINRFQNGDYRYALNARIGSTFKNNDGALENLPSTLLINSYYTWNGVNWVSQHDGGPGPPDGVNTTINKYEDHTETKIYFAVHNSNGNHILLLYSKNDLPVTNGDISDGKIYELLQWSGLNFSLQNFVSMTKINKYLFLTDGNPSDGTGNPPRIIDVTTIFQLKRTLSTNFSEFHISLAKWLPVKPPKVSAGSAATNDFISKGIFQFAYRYIYIGGFNSCWSPPSNFVSNEFGRSVNPDTNQPEPLIGTPVTFNITTNGWLFDYNNPDNTSFQHSDIKFYDFVQFIEYAYRQSTSDTWKVFTKITVTNPPTSVVFDNSGPTRTVADSDIGQYFDSIPLLSRSVEAVDNRVMLANNLDDLEPLADFDVTNIEVYSAETTDDNWFKVSALAVLFQIQKFTFKENGIYKLGIIFQHYSGRTGLVQTLDKWTYNIPNNSPTTILNPLAQEQLHALGFKIPDSVIPPIWATGYQIVRSNCLNIDYFVYGVVNYIRYLHFDTSGNDGAVTIQSEVKDVISGYYDNFNSGSGAQYNLISRVLTSIRKSLIDLSIDSSTLIYFDITNWFLNSIAEYNPAGTKVEYSQPANNVYYNWQPGDRIRFWGSTDADHAHNPNAFPFTRFDEEIIAFTGNGVIIAKPLTLLTLNNRAWNGSYPYPSQRQFTIEIYRPSKFSLTNSVLFYEMGEWYPIIKPTTPDRDFGKRDFTWSGTSNVSVTTVNGFAIYNKFPIWAGDVWPVMKNFYFNGKFNEAIPVITDSSVFFTVNQTWIGNKAFNSLDRYPVFPQMTVDRNNAAGEWEHNTGRVLVAYESLPVQFEKSSQIRFGGKFLENSLFIGVNKFLEANQFLYPSEYGKIRALVNTSNTQVKNVGNILLAICEEETMSIYVNRTTLEDLAGNTQVSLSDKVLGSYNTLLGSHGTLNPESISKKNSRVLFWNAKKGGWIRYSDDGLTVISDNFMSIWFNDLILLLRPTYNTDTPAVARSVYDPYYDEWITFLDHSTLPATFRGYDEYKCASFSEREADKRWKSILSYGPEAFASLDNETYSIIGTVVHIHQGGDDFGSIYGIKRDTLFQPIANDLMRTTKVWRSLNLQTTDKWSFPSIVGDFQSNNGTMQESRLLLTDLQNLEGTYWADIKRNINTPNAPDAPSAVVDGEPMRSRGLTMMMKLDPSVTWLSLLNWLIVKFTISEKTVKK